jgi:hypothetical protein
MDHIPDFDDNEHKFNDEDPQDNTPDDLQTAPNGHHHTSNPTKSRNPHIRGAHSEKPNSRHHNQLGNDMHNNGIFNGADQDESPEDEGGRKNKFKDGEHGRHNILNDSSPTKSKAIKTMSLGRQIRKKQFKDYPKPLNAEQTMNFIVESFLEGDEGY